jgi:hypothetical protein
MRPLNRFGRLRAPWFQAQVPVIRVRSLWRVSATSVASSRPLALTQSRPATGFQAGVARLRPQVCTLPPGHQPRSHDGFLSAGGFPRDDSRFPPPGFHLAVLRAHTGHSTFSYVASPTASYGLHATPASKAQQSFLTPYLVRIPTNSGGLGFSSLLRRLCALTSTRTVSGLLRSIAAVTLRPAGYAGYPCLCA